MLKMTSAALLVATLALALAPRTKETASNRRPFNRGALRVSFEEVQIGGKARGRIRHDSSLGTEFKASVWGSERVRVATDGIKYWFWMRDYDSKRHYECPLESVQSTSLIPPMRPSFIVWIINNRSPKEPLNFRDGEYDVELEIRDGSVTKQTYKRDGSVEARLEVKAFQISSGMEFPALATLEIGGDLIEINMGPAETTNPIAPNTEPPSWSEAAELNP